MKKKKQVKKRIKVTRFEKLLYIFTILLIVLSPVAIVFSKATLSEINFEVEKQKKEIAEQKKTNESLNMTINELASLSKIQQVADEQGLSYNNSNVKTITEEDIEKEKASTKEE